MATTHDTTSLIADSSGLVSLLVPTDDNHALAVRASERLFPPTVTILVPCDVFSETVNVLGKKAGHDVAAAAADYLLSTPPFSVSDTTETLRQGALQRFRDQPGSVSFTDCLVMALADEYETREIFGFDEAFGKNGYHTIGE
jgi:predicted nucleic acid-binding protein